MHVTDVSLDASGARFRLQAADLRCDVAVGLRGEHQVWNTCTAIAALNASGEKYRPTPDLLATGIANLELPGRCQIAGDVIFDVAHNPDGIGVLVSTLGAIFPGEEFMVLFSALTDKEWREMMRRLAPVARHIILTTAPTAPAIRRWDLNDARRAAVEMGLSHEVKEDFDVALASVMNAGVRVLVTGSFHTVGDAMHRLQVSPLTR
jgi:dihydrofolate synthase/folylpolyglutamate synthase